MTAPSHRPSRTRPVTRDRLARSIMLAIVVALPIAALSACGTTSTSQTRAAAAPSPFIIFDNRTDSVVRVTIESGERGILAESYRPTATGAAQTVRPGDTFAYRVPDATPLSSDAVAGVHRVRVEALGATWEQPTVTWWEVVGIQPRRIDLSGSKRSVALRPSGGGKLVQVPVQQWLDRPAEAAAQER